MSYSCCKLKKILFLQNDDFLLIMLRKSLVIIVSLLLCCFCVQAEVVVLLNSGAQFTGTIENQNDDVVVILTRQGKRYQFPKSDISKMTEIEVVAEQKVERHRGNFAIRFHLEGACSALNKSHGGSHGGGLVLGASNLFNRRIFMGGGIGIDYYSVGKKALFLPLTFSLDIPFMIADDTPYVGFEAGYGFALKKAVQKSSAGVTRGGFKGCVSIGWQHRFNNRTSTLLALFAGMQHALLTATESVGGMQYDFTADRLLPQVGVRFTAQL